MLFPLLQKQALVEKSVNRTAVAAKTLLAFIFFTDAIDTPLKT
jgi:hypothetical protein